jgi:CelD/BcsL family acetyltransferase involved in cellulose biosynthesis
MNGRITLHLANRPEEFQTHWLELEAQGMCYPFQKYSWIKQWCDSLAQRQSAHPCLILAACEGAPFLILPLCIIWRGPIRSLEFIDGGVSDYNAPVLSSNAHFSVQEFEVLFRRMQSALPAHDCTELHRMPNQVGPATNPMLLLSHNIYEEEEVGHRLELENYEALTRSVLKEAQKKRRRLARSGRSIELVDSHNSAAFETLINWKRQQFPGCTLDNEDVVEFYRGLLKHSSDARLYQIYCAGKLIAAQFAAVSNETCVGLINGYDPELHDISPGMLLMTALLPYLRGQGYSVLDLGRGKETYKANYGYGWRQLFIYRKAVTMSGRAYLIARDTAHWAKKKAKALAA